MRWVHCFLIVVFVLLFVGCGGKSVAPNPWGTKEGAACDSIMGLDEIVVNGELIMVTMSGPDTYYEYHGRGMGLHFMLLEGFCQEIGVALRVDICRDTTEMVERVLRGEADVIAMPLKGGFEGLEMCATNASDGAWHWLVNERNMSLAEALDRYMDKDVLTRVSGELQRLLGAPSVRRRVFAPMMDRGRGIISEWDYLFKRYASVAGWDWHLLAAQCYQESTFDARARSWAGACGLMQIMPSTADELGLARGEIYDAEKNIACAARYIAMLSKGFSDVVNPTERIRFVLAAYNGGARHVRDAMALAEKGGLSPYSWANVRGYILGLERAECYNDPVVKYGYMRGSETVDYVERIWSRWMEYRGLKGGSGGSVDGGKVFGPEPRPAGKRKEKYSL